jgi:hypothetical protein
LNYLITLRRVPPFPTRCHSNVPDCLFPSLPLPTYLPTHCSLRSLAIVSIAWLARGLYVNFALHRRAHANQTIDISLKRSPQRPACARFCTIATSNTGVHTNLSVIAGISTPILPTVPYRATAPLCGMLEITNTCWIEVGFNEMQHLTRLRC